MRTPLDKRPCRTRDQVAAERRAREAEHAAMLHRLKAPHLYSASTLDRQTWPMARATSALIVLSSEDLEHRERWGAFPVLMRPFWIAQRALCPYCGDRLPLERGRRQRPATWDHVRPLSAGGDDDECNKVLAHRPCNERKGDRPPTACEILFCAITNEIVLTVRSEK